MPLSRPPSNRSAAARRSAPDGSTKIDDRTPWPAVGGAASARESRWLLDCRRSTVEFVATQLWGVRRIRGEFSLLGGVIDLRLGCEPEINVTIAAASVFTRDRKRDERLRSAAFLDTAAYPEIRCLATTVSARSGTELWLSGELTLAGRTTPVRASAIIVRVDNELDVVVRKDLGFGQLGLRPGRLYRRTSRLTVTVRARMVEQGRAAETVA